MKKKCFFGGVLGLLALIPLGASAEDVLMPQLGKQVITVSSDNPIMFYDYKGTDAIAASSANNSFATTIFKPAQEGFVVTVTFSEVDLHSDGDNWPAKLRIYSGLFDTTSVTYPEAANGVTATGFPETENMLAVLDGTYSNLTYTSTDATGALSCCFHFRYPKKSEGWVATVSAVELKPMVVTSAAADYSDVEGSVYANKSSVVLGALNIATEDLAPADTLKTLSFTLAQNGVYDATQLRLYQGNTAVDAALSQNGDTYTFSLNQALTTGDNKFRICGDVLETATVDATSTFAITGVSTFNGYATLTTATPVRQTVIPMALMANGKHLYVTIDRETPFYDDGGADGKISFGFEGYATFLPAHAGQKVQIDMRNIHIFYTEYAANSTGNTDILAFYNGVTASADSLVYTMKVNGGKLDNYSLKSTAENGALTVYLKSIHQIAYNQGAGFEATVSEFTPQAMEVESSSVAKQSGSVAGCTQGVQAMQFCLKTKNTEPALTPTMFQFTTGDTYERIAKATLYFTGASSTFATTQKVGETDGGIGGNEFGIAASGVTLAEGENYFFLTYDVACSAQNGQTVEANIAQVDFSNGTEYKGFVNSEEALTIDNTCHSDCGEKAIDVYGEWQFTHTNNKSGYSTNYHAEICDQTTIFRPTAEGHIIQMAFEDFAVYYSSSSYGAKAVFKVYAGQGTSGDLLWEADASNCKVGPGLIRSTADDGALTVLFNPNESSSYYTDKGWHATVTEYKRVPMQLESTEITALSGGALTRGQKRAELLGLNVATSGNLTPLGVKEMTVTLGGGCAAAIDSLLLLQGETLVAKAAVTGTEVVLQANATLAEGENAYTLAANIAADAAIGTEVSVATVQIVVGEATLAPEVPANMRVVRNMYLLKSGDQRVEVGTDPLYFYDDGGAEGKITLGINGTATFVPTVENTAIQLTFKQWVLNGADNFYVYYGEATKDAADVSLSYYTEDIENLTIISTDATGALTITYEANNYYATDGWEIEVSCHELQPVALDSIVVSDVSATTVNRGSADVKVLRAAVYVSGDRGKMPVENFNVENTFGAEAVKVYGTGTLDAFGTTNLLVGADTITNRGAYYYWITLDVPVATEEGAIVTAALKSVDVDKASVQPNNEVTASFEVIGGMHGTYLVGASDAAKYKTIQSAVDALRNGVESAVTFLIEPGTYAEYITIPEVDGVSAENTVTFRSQTGNREDVIIKYDNYVAQSSSQGDETQGIVNVNGADYITFSNLTLTTGHTSYHAIVYVCNNAEHITIDSCYIYRAENTTTTAMRLVYANSKSETTNNNYFTLSHSTLKGGYAGVNVSGNWTNKQIGAHIIGNTFDGQGAQAILISLGEANAVVDGNIVRKTVESDKSTWCIDLRLSEGAQISNNYVSINLATTACHGLYVRDINGTEDAPERIYNNVVDMTNAAVGSNSYGIYFNKNVQNVILANNTVRTSGAATYPLYIQKNGTNLQVINNLLYSNALPAAWIPSASYVSKFEHNLLYSENGSFGKVGATEYTDIAEWRTAIGSATDITEAVQFGSDALRPAEKGNLISAEALDFVTADITGRGRAAVPTIGAYEWVDKTITGSRLSESADMRVFPTLTRDVLYVSGAANATVRVLNVQGQQMFGCTLTMDEQALNVGALPQGIYLLDVDGTIFRFIKR